MTVFVVTMVIEPAGCAPVDQGVQAICADMDAFHRWLAKEWPKAHFKQRSDNVWEFFMEDGTSLDAFICLDEMEIFE